MCQATIGKVVSIGKGRITIEYNGKKRELDSKLVKVVKGDYVLFSSDIAIEKVDADDMKGGVGCV